MGFFGGAAHGGRLSDASGATETDGNLAVFDDDRHFALVATVPQHLVDEVWIADQVFVDDVVTVTREVLTGRGGVVSGVLAIDGDLFRHEAPLWDRVW